VSVLCPVSHVRAGDPADLRRTRGAPYATSCFRLPLSLNRSKISAPRTSSSRIPDRAHGEDGIGMFADKCLQLVPVSAVVTNFHAAGTDGEKAAQYFTCDRASLSWAITSSRSFSSLRRRVISLTMLESPHNTSPGVPYGGYGKRNVNPGPVPAGAFGLVISQDIPTPSLVKEPVKLVRAARREGRSLSPVEPNISEAGYP
jgi:hypothetical protein